jgi:hypothetical protein
VVLGFELSAFITSATLPAPDFQVLKEGLDSSKQIIYAPLSVPENSTF